MNKRQILGQLGEDMACDYLIGLGYEVVERNWRHGRLELDIIAKTEGILVFIEVKTKKSDEFRPPEASVGEKKRQNLVDLANRYMEEVDYFNEIRFDIVAIVVHSSASYTLKHIKDAFFPGMR